MTLVDGKQLAAQLYEEVRAAIAIMPRAPRLAILTCQPNFETTKYLELKRRRATEVGIELTIVEMPAIATTEAFLKTIETLEPTVDGIVVQLPLPAHIDREQVLAAIPAAKDPDCFSQAGLVLSPVVGAIDEIAKQYGVSWRDKHVVVLGHGRLVGAPAAAYAAAAGATVSVVTESSADQAATIRAADILIAGAGQPHLVQPAMVKPGVVVFDAATSEASGELQGDVHPAVSEQASLFTPVPGGIGPVTVAILLRNVVLLLQRRQDGEIML